MKKYILLLILPLVAFSISAQEPENNDHADLYKAARNQMISEIGNGFYWMKGLVELLHDYENDRAEYPTLGSFMPVIVSFYEKTAKDSETLYEFRH